MDILKKIYIEELTKIISLKLGEKLEPTIENVLANLKCLVVGNYDEVTAISEPKSWLPVSYKRMLFFILFGNDAYLDTSCNWEEDRCISTCFIRKNDNGNILAKAIASCPLDEVDPFNSAITLAKRKTICEGYACGSAESRALYRIGIGMQFVGDIDNEIAKYSPGGNNNDVNEKLETEESPEKMEAMKALNDKFEELSENTAPSSDSANNTPAAEKAQEPDYDQVCLFGQTKGEKLRDTPPKFLGWMLASIDTDQNLDEVDKTLLTEDYINNLRAIVNADERIVKVYNSFMKRK